MPSKILPGIAAFGATRFLLAGLASGTATLIALASLAAFTVPCTSGAAQLDPEDAMVEEFQSFCLDYYTSTQCADAIQFILRTSGDQYSLHLDNDESKDGFLDQLARAVTGGEASLAQEALAAKPGN
jgi:hypothetical protein